MNDWVGGGDPATVGGDCYFHLKRRVFIEDATRVLDFGCGIGRTIAALLAERPAQPVVGIDMMEPAIDFCREQITARFPNARFELIADRNQHYDHHTSAGSGRSPQDLAAQYREGFDLAYAFSVFTHADQEDFARLLGFLAQVLRPRGQLYLTYFGLTPHARARIAADGCQFKFPSPLFTHGGQTFIGNADDPTAFIAHEPGRIEEIAFAAGFMTTQTETGCWAEEMRGWSFQDVMVLERL